MKPHWVSLQAFGPYADKEIVDFEKLNDQRLFLIHGSTGAGKSSILDAICFALYGETSGKERDGSSMRSHHAPDSLLTEVELEFSLKETRYRVMRRPAQEVAKTRGEGTTTKPHQATLWRLTSAEDDNPEVLESKAGDVTRRVEELLGFKAGQFRQVVVLPQGAFRSFLLADSQDRQTILRTLFQTDIYSRLQDALARVAKERAAEVQTLNERKAALFHEVMPNEDQPTRELLAALLAERAQVVSTVAEESRKAVQETQTARNALEEGKQLAQRFVEWAAARTEAEGLREQAPRMEEKERERELGRKALRCQESHRVLIQRQQEQRQAAQALEELRGKQTQATEALQSAVTALTQAEENARQEDRLTLHLETLRKSLTAAKQLAEVQGRADTADREEKALREQQKELHAKLDAAKKRLKETDATLKAHQQQAAGLAMAQEQLRQASQRLAWFDAYQTCCSQYAKKNKTRKQQRILLEQAQADHKNAAELLTSLRKAHQEGRAVLVAQSLVEGSPCPVCGSKDHPHPARASGVVIPTDEEMTKQEQCVSEAGQAVETQSQRLHEIERELTRFKEQGNGLGIQLGEYKKATPESLQADVRQSEQAVVQAKQADKQRASLEGSAQKQNDALQAMETQRETLAERIVLAAKRNESAQKDLASANQETGERDAVYLETEIHAVSAQLEGIRQALKTARERQQTELAISKRLDGERSQADRSLAQAEKALAEHETGFREALHQAGFEDEAALLQARRDEAHLLSLEEELSRYHRTRERNQETLELLERELSSCDEPKLLDLKQAVTAAEQRLESIQQQQGRAKEQHKQAEGALKRLDSLQASLDLAESGAAHTKRLADIARGKVTGEEKISLESYVLATVLDEVLIKAGERLFEMSNHHYRLERKEEGSHKGSPAGLDLVVRDHTTGSVRDVRTLSGGESFMASLCLALGLSDVVQSYSGGVHLDTLFIDEGFGSLDVESLDRALQSLVSLIGANRLVGIISHVEELKTRIPARLEVIRNTQGSGIRWHLP